MNPDTLRSLDRALDRLERQAGRPRRRFSTSPFVLGIGLAVGDVLLTRLVPMVWASLLPGGLEQAATLRGWPALVWRAAVYCHVHQGPVQAAIGVAVVVSLLLSFMGGRPLRIVVWLCAVGVILADAGILVVTIQSSLSATAADVGLDLG